MTLVPVEAAKNIKNAAELWYNNIVAKTCLELSKINNIVAIKRVINEASAC